MGEGRRGASGQSLVLTHPIGLSRLTGLGAPHALAAGTSAIVVAHLAVFQPATTRAVAYVRHVASRHVVGHAEWNVAACTFGRVDTARLARSRACRVAADAIRAEAALALRVVAAHRPVAFGCAVGASTVDAAFIAVLHVVAARDAFFVIATRVCPGVAIGISDALDTLGHRVAHAAVAVCADIGVCRHRGTVVTTLDGAHVAVKRRCVAVVVDLHGVAHAVASVCLAVTVRRIVDLHACWGKRHRADVHHRARPIRTRCVVGTVAILHALHAAA